LLPTLFKNKHPTNLPGLTELKLKLEDMGLEEFFQTKNINDKIGKGNKNLKNEPFESNQPWYYLGP
jgi:hypothetical protein